MYANGVEREIQQQVRALSEKSGSPKRWTDEESPFRRIPPFVGARHLKKTDQRVGALERRRKARMRTGRPLTCGPVDESFESLECRGRWRDEPRDLVVQIGRASCRERGSM